MISGLMDIILVIGAWKKIKWMIYLWIVLSYSQSVLISAFFIFVQFYWPVVVCLILMAMISILGFKLVQNIAVEKDTDYSEMINLTNNDAWKMIYVNNQVTRSKCQHFCNFDLPSKLYIPSTLNTDYLLWYTQLIVCARVQSNYLAHFLSSQMALVSPFFKCLGCITLPTLAY